MIDPQPSAPCHSLTLTVDEASLLGVALVTLTAAQPVYAGATAPLLQAVMKIEEIGYGGGQSNPNLQGPNPK